MSGKWPIFAVLGLGLVASVCAAVLMAALKAGSVEGPTEPTTVEILVASADLPSMSRLEESMLETREVGLEEKPEGAFTDPVQVLGRVLRAGLVEGQPLLEAGLLKDEGGAQLASSLPSGMRAVSVEINGSSAMRGLLFPGCRVDVIVAYKYTPGRPRDASPVSETLLQNVSVLAVEDKTVFTDESEGDEKSAATVPTRRTVGRGLMVTLMVDPQQARELQSARDLGELSLSLRNPLDDSLTADPSNAENAEGPPVAMDEPPAEARGPWQMVVIRGGKTEVLEFDGGKVVVPPFGPEPDRVADVPTEIDDRIE
jgi:pilus assembly protein CpaB